MKISTPFAPIRHILLQKSLILVCLCGFWSANAFAQSPFDDGWMPDETRDHAPTYNGSFTSIGARVGNTWLIDHPYEGWSIDLGPRMALPFMLTDMRLHYRYDALTDTKGALGDMSVHSMGLELAMHPFYLFILGSDWISYVAGSFYIDIGLGAQVAWRERPTHADTRASRDFGFTWHWGAGIDIPLWNPDEGQALWVNVLYHNKRADFDLGPDAEIDLSMHSVFIGLEWRVNTLLF